MIVAPEEWYKNYWMKFLIVYGLVGLVLARVFLIEPLIRALKK